MKRALEHVDPSEQGHVFYKWLDREKAKLRGRQEGAAAQAELQRQATRASQAVPDDAGVNRLIRYETAIERQLYRAIGELEKLQQARRGKGKQADPPTTASG